MNLDILKTLVLGLDRSRSVKSTSDEGSGYTRKKDSPISKPPSSSAEYKSFTLASNKSLALLGEINENVKNLTIKNREQDLSPEKPVNEEPPSPKQSAVNWDKAIDAASAVADNGLVNSDPAVEAAKEVAAPIKKTFSAFSGIFSRDEEKWPKKTYNLFRRRFKKEAKEEKEKIELLEDIESKKSGDGGGLGLGLLMRGLMAGGVLAGGLGAIATFFIKKIPVIGALFSAGSIFSADNDKDKKKSIGGFTGMLAGAGLGSLFLPPFGTIIGAIIGGVIGEKFGEEAIDYIGSMVDKVVQKVEDTFKGFVQNIKDTFDSVVQSVKDFFANLNPFKGGDTNAGGFWNGFKNLAKEGFGAISRFFESSGASSSTISAGKGDHGGVSYGRYQLSSNKGVADDFVRSSKYADRFKGLKAGSSAFGDMWKQVVKEDEESFKQAEDAYVKKKYYDKAIKDLGAKGKELSGRGKAIQEMILSSAVQFGGSGWVVGKALKGMDLSKMSDKDIINAVQDYKKKNNETLFKKSEPNVRASTLARADKEREALTALLGDRSTKRKDITAVSVMANKKISTPIFTPPFLPKINKVDDLAKNSTKNQKNTIIIGGGSNEDVSKKLNDVLLASIASGGVS